MAAMISSLVDLPVAVGELLLVVADGEVLLGESWLFIFVAHKIGSFVDSWPSLFLLGSLGFKFWQLPDFGNFGNLVFTYQAANRSTTCPNVKYIIFYPGFQQPVPVPINTFLRRFHLAQRTYIQ
jgi:hypothetical protein